jgi:hypothetical protein
MQLFKWGALSACVFTCGVSAAGSAQAQFFDLSLRSSHSAYAPGMPQTFSSTAPTQSNGQPTAFDGAAATQYSLEGVFLSGARANGVTLPVGGQTIGELLALEPNIRLIPAEPGYDTSLTVRAETVGSLADADVDLDSFQYDGACRVNPGFNDRVGLPVGSVVGPCSAIDGSLKLNGVTFRLTSPQDSIALTFAVPEVGYAFTSNLNTSGPTDPFIRRKDSLRQVDENFFASGKAPQVVARLLGQPDGFVLPKGVLPNAGNAITGSLTVGSVTKTFGVANPGQLLAYAIANRNSSFSDFGIAYSDSCFRAGGVVTGTCSAASAVLNIVGIEVRAETAANSPDVTFTAPDLDLTFTSSGTADRDDALGDFIEYADENADRGKITAAYARYLAQNTPNNPLVGNPYSAQGQLTRAALDLDSPSETLDETNNRNGQGRGQAPDTSGWMIGGRAGHLSAGEAEAQFVDGLFERGFRVREGSRMRLKISVPVSYIDYGSNRGGDGGRTATLGLRTTLEVPLIDGRWVVEPIASAAAFYSSNEVSSGALYLVGVSSRYKLAPVGRGHIIIGNAVTHSSSLHIEAGDFSTPKIQNTAFRNGVAYQVPYGRFLGRQGTVRASYTYTHLIGDDVFVDEYHEVSLSYGVGSREAAVKQIGETLRFGVNGAFGHDFTAVSLTAGYRF